MFIIHYDFLHLLHKPLATKMFCLGMLDTFDTAGMTMMQKCSDYGLHDFVQVLLDFGANANSTTDETSTKPVLLASYSGHADVLRVFLEHKKVSRDNVTVARFDVQDGYSKESLLHYILKMSKKMDGAEMLNNYRQCFDLLFDEYDSTVDGEIKKIINKRDSSGNSALHYATQNWSQE